MTAEARPSVAYLLRLSVLFQVLTLVLAAPSLHPYSTHIVLYARKTDPIVSHSANGSVIILDPATQQTIPQGPGTDGSGSGFSLPAVLWIIFLLVIGVPLAVAGIRGWRGTTGISISLAAMVCSWAAIINSVTEVGVSDILLTLIVFAFGFLGLVLGIFEFARIASMVVMSIMGGLAFGLRIALVKKDLLISSSFVLNWIVIVVFGVGTGLLLIWRPRAAMVISCASTGTFLTALGVDLIFNKQSGLSIGLRTLFDQNDNHFAFFIESPYDPSLFTRIILYTSLGLTPILAVAQHRIFKGPFTRKPPPPSDEELCLNYPTEDNSANRGTAFFSGLWDGARLSASRFSI